jgi:hypothetical protein
MGLCHARAWLAVQGMKTRRERSEWRNMGDGGEVGEKERSYIKESDVDGLVQGRPSLSQGVGACKSEVERRTRTG